MKFSIVTTTIHVPELLTQYAENARRYGHAEVDFIVIGDRKTPAEAAEFCRSVPYYPCRYFDLAEQQRFLKPFPELWAHLRFDSIQRRNIGMLMAYTKGADAAITIDDDNFAMEQDFIGCHSIAATVQELPAYGSTSGWFNVCSCLRTDHDVPFYHRGFPRENRWTEASHFISSFRLKRRVAVNAGLWLDDPDIDALTRMDRQIVVRGFNEHWTGSNFALAPGVWSPFNSQNTAIARDVIPAYFLSPYIGRYDDIWGSYIVSRIAERLNDVIAFGEPLVRQERNPHDLWKDLDVERNGMILTAGFTRALRSIRLQGTTYHECFGEIAEALPEAWTPGPAWNESQQQWRNKLLEGLHLWHATFEQLGARQSRAA